MPALRHVLSKQITSEPAMLAHVSSVNTLRTNGLFCPCTCTMLAIWITGSFSGSGNIPLGSSIRGSSGRNQIGSSSTITATTKDVAPSTSSCGAGYSYVPTSSAVPARKSACTKGAGRVVTARVVQHAETRKRQAQALLVGALVGALAAWAGWGGPSAKSDWMG